MLSLFNKIWWPIRIKNFDMNSFLKISLKFFVFCWSYFSYFQIIDSKWTWDTSKSYFWCQRSYRLTTFSILRNDTILFISTNFIFHQIFKTFFTLISDESFESINLFWLVLFTNNFWSFCNSKRRLRHPGHALCGMLESTRILKVRKKGSIISWRLGFLLIMGWTHYVFFRYSYQIIRLTYWQ